MTIHVLVPVHNRAHFTSQFLASVAQQECGERINAVVIDDGSTDHTREVAKSFEATMITGDGSWWWAGSVQQGLDHVLPELASGDFVYLGNNDTVLAPNHLQSLVDAVSANPQLVAGSVSNEIWPDGTINPVSAGFWLNPAELTVRNAGIEVVVGVDALAGRGVMLSSAAARAIRFSPGAMPQHFADLAATARLMREGFTLGVEPAAVSTQLERAGSSVEFQPALSSMWSKRSSIYLPALWNFWWSVSSPAQRTTLAFRFLARGLRQVRSGTYA